jgi:hypothetical protein
MMASLVRSVTAWRATLVWFLVAATPEEKLSTFAGGREEQPARRKVARAGRISELRCWSTGFIYLQEAAFLF